MTVELKEFSVDDLGSWWVYYHGPETSFVQNYWDSWTLSYRRHLLAGLSMLPQSPTSVYEVGCASGPNFRLLRHQHPTLALGGMEPIEGARTWVHQQFPDIVVDEGFIHERAPFGQWDAVVSCYALAYCTDDQVRQALRHMTEHATVGLVLLEPVPRRGVPSGCVQRTHDDGSVQVPEWRHDYAAMLPPGWRVDWKWPITDLSAHHGLDCGMTVVRE